MRYCKLFSAASPVCRLPPLFAGPTVFAPGRQINGTYPVSLEIMDLYGYTGRICKLKMSRCYT